MTRVDELELPRFDYTDPELRGARFHTALRELRAQGWLAAGPFGYIVLDREAGEFFLRTRSAIFPGLKIAEIFDVREGPLAEEMRRNILHINGPDHTRLRNLVNPALSPRAVERYRPVMRELLDGLWEGLAGLRRPGECEFVETFAKPYPSQAIAHFMGAPLQDAPRLHHWSNWIQRQFDAISMAQERAGIEQAVAEFYEYAWALLRTRREDPRDDLISALIAAEEEGQRLSDVECVNLVLNVLVGGVDTTQSQLAHALRLFAEHPEQWVLLAQQPELAARAVEEVLRFEPITPFTARIVVEELTFRDVTFPAETIVMVCAFTGNRDVDGGAGDGEAFDITAARGRARALTFGAGVHYCVGANLARVELEEALAYLAPRMPRLELAGEPLYEAITGIYGLAELPLRFAAA
jgi:cytochrome P450